MGWFREPRGPFYHVSENHDLEVHDTPEKCTIKPKKSEIGLILFNVPFILFGLLFIVMGFATSALSAYYIFISGDESCQFTEREPLTLGDGQVFCFDETILGEYDGLETNDSHFNYIKNNGDKNFKWSSQGSYIVVGQEFSGHYGCLVYVPLQQLSANWTYADIVDESVWYNLPEWCENEPEDHQYNFSQTDESMFEGDKLILIESDWVGRITFVEFTNSSIHETYYYQDYEESIIDSIFPLIFAIIGFGIINFVDDRRFVLEYHRTTKLLKLRKSFGGTRLSGWTWYEVDMNNLHNTENDLKNHNYDDLNTHETIKQITLSIKHKNSIIDLIHFINPHGESLWSDLHQKILRGFGIEVQKQLPQHHQLKRNEEDKEDVVESNSQDSSSSAFWSEISD